MLRIFKCLNNDKLKALKKKHDNAVQTVNSTEEEIINEVFHIYINEAERQCLLKDAEKYHFSEIKLSNIKEVFTNFNQDTLKYNVAIDVLDAREHVQREKKESFFSRIGNIIPEDELDDENGDI